MKTVADLGRAMKRKHPKKYNHLSDEVLGRAIKKKNPNKYTEYKETSLATYDGGSLAETPSRASLVEQMPDKINPQFNQKVKKLIKYYNPERGRFTSWWQRGKAEGRGKLLTALNEEQRLVIEQGAMLEEAFIKGQRSRVEFEQFIAQHQHLLIQLQAESVLIDYALQVGLPLQEYSEVKKEELLLQLRSREKDDDSTRRIKETREITDIELENRWKEITQDLEAAELTVLGQRQLVERLLTRLNSFIEERHTIEIGDKPEAVKRAILSNYDSYIINLQEEIHKRQKRLLDT